MKKIFGNIRTLAALLIASATLAACSTEDSVMTDEKAPQVYTLTIDASMDGGAQTRALEFEGTKLVAKWANDETVDVRRGATPLGTLTVSNVSADGKTCTLSGTLTGTINKEDGLNFHYNIASLVNESQTGTLSSTAASDYAMAAVTVKSVNGGNITLESEPSFQTQVAVLKITMQDALANKLNATSLKIKIGDKDLCTLSPSATAYTENGDGVVYFALPSAHRVYLIGSIGLDDAGLAAATVTFTATAGGDTYITTKTGYPFAAGKYYATTLTMTKQAAAPAGAEAVDLGLPSGTLWANMNVGATSESDYGDFFAWGETEPYYSSLSPLAWKTGKTAGYAWASYKFTTDGGNSFTKYNSIDYKTTLDPEDDAAHVNWGGDWRMPTYDELNELLATKSNANYTWEWTTVNGHKGYKITNNTTTANIFLPASGGRYDASLGSQGSEGDYWSSSLSEFGAQEGSYLSFRSNSASINSTYRFNGFSVRPVQGAPAPAVPTGALSGKFTINSSGKQVYFSKGNLYYDANATTKWYFAANQWDYVSTATGYPMDHFTWGNIDSPTYNGTTGLSGSSDLSGNTDWGSNIGEGWCTLSKDEWVYLFKTHTVNGITGNGYSYTLGQSVNDVLGVVLYPDDYTGSTYSGSDWSTFESAGCVFLPAAGIRGGTSLYSVGSTGFYWSSTADGSALAYYMYFNSGNVNPANNDERHPGVSVRLVRPVQPNN